MSVGGEKDGGSDDRTSIVIVAGTTACGKTAAAVELALASDGELVSADSVQVYRGFDIGSAKPTASELRGVRQHGVDWLEPEQSADAVAFAAHADRAIADIRSRARLPIVVGGTGLWLRALTRGLVALPAPDPELRTRLEAEAQVRGTAALHAELKRVDPITAARIHVHDQLRIVRGLEVYQQTGRPLGDHQATHALGQPRYRSLFIVLDRPRDELSQRIAERVDAMLAMGWVDEVRGLLTRHAPTARAFGAIGYRQILEHLVDHVPLAETRKRIIKTTRIYARRQRTWFAREPGVDWRTTPEQLLAPHGRERIAGFVGG